MINKKHKKDYTALNCIEHSLILVIAITGCGWNSAFASLVGIPVGISSSPVGLKIYGITTGNKINLLCDILF